MGVKVWMSNRLDLLADHMRFSQQDPMRQRMVVAQTEGLKHWLSLRLAKRDGIFTNFRFFKPNDIIHSVGRIMRIKDTRPYDAENLRWWVYQVIDDKLFKKQFPNVAAYFLSDDLKRIQLASKLADLFDQYVIYRSDMVEEWNESKTIGDPSQAWQRWIWKATKEKFSKDYIDKTEFRLTFMERIQFLDNQDKIKNSIAEVHIFGLSVITKYHLEILHAISNVVDVNFYFLNPSPSEYWYDCLSEKEIAKKWAKHTDREFIEESSRGNSLLTAWGKIGREMYSELLELDDDFINNTNIIYEPNQQKTLLERVQFEMNENMLLEDRQQISEALIQDKSIQLTSNYTEVREVETLYNYLLDKIDESYKEDKIEPQDIVIMVPEIQKYAPFIKAIFDNTAVKLPYSIGDEPINNNQSISFLLISILSINEGEFTSENILKLLDHQAIVQHYGFKDLQQIRDAVRDCAIRFGIKGKVANETNFVSWEQGLLKMVFGVAMRDEVFEGGDVPVFPYENAEGSVTEDLLRLVRFVNDLIRIVKITKKERSLIGWIELIHDVLETFTEESSDNEEEFVFLRQKLFKLGEVEEQLGEIRINFSVFYYIFQDFHQQEVRKDGYFRGRITFCTALPMRSIPFKVICFLGLNADAFPRKSTYQAFDLIQNSAARRGDRNVKDNDRYLFLEALLSAQSCFYASYIGRSAKSNKEKTPSILLDELVDYVQIKAPDGVDVQKTLMQHHPLHRYSTKYLNEKSGLVTYFPIHSNESVRVALNEKGQVVSDDVARYQIQWKDVVKFYNDPVKWYFAQELGIYFNDEDLSLPEEEVFDFEDGLANYGIKTKLLPLKEKSLSAFILKEKQKGIAPLANLGELQIRDKYYNELGTYRSEYQKLTSGIVVVKKVFNLQLNKNELECSVNDFYGDKLVRANFSSNKNRIGKSLFPLFLDLLVLRADKIDCDAFLICKKETIKLEGGSVSPEKAIQLLEKYIGIFEKHKHELIPFNSVLSYTSLLEKEKDYITTLKKQLEYDEHVAIVHEERDLWEFEVVQELANELLQPMLDLKQNS